MISKAAGSRGNSWLSRETRTGVPARLEALQAGQGLGVVQQLQGAQGQAHPGHRRVQLPQHPQQEAPAHVLGCPGPGGTG